MAKSGRKKSKQATRAQRGARTSTRAGGVASSTRGLKSLRRLDETFHERRFAPKASSRMVVGTVVLSLSGVTLGVGTYAKWFRADVLGPWEYAHYALALGVLLLVAYFAIVRELAKVIRVGDLGLAIETPGSGIERVGWYKIQALRMQGQELRVAVGERTIRVPLAEHAAAARRLLAEAGRRIPGRIALGGAERKRVGKPASDEGQPVVAEPPQVAGLQCTASGDELTFEQDVRLCGFCAAPYDRKSVPERCTQCDQPLAR